MAAKIAAWRAKPVSTLYSSACWSVKAWAAAPFFAAVFERIFLGVRISALTGGCMCLAALGLVLFALESVISGSTNGGLNHGSNNTLFSDRWYS